MKVTLYGAPGCHLCESARRVIDGVRSETTFELEEVNITGDPELELRYRERIPVVAVNGEEAFTYFVHPEGLRRRLGVEAGAQSASETRTSQGDSSRYGA